jgi:protein SCO1
MRSSAAIAVRDARATPRARVSADNPRGQPSHARDRAQPKPDSHARHHGRLALVVVGLVIWLASTLLPPPDLGAWLARLRAADAPPATPAPAAFQAGTPLDGALAPTFTLRDQNGVTISLDRFRGEPVVLTFFDSVCPHQDCPIMAQDLQWASHLLGGRTSRVAWVALSLNPWHDTPATARTFTAAHDVKFPLHYLLGSLNQMSALWSAYHMESVLQSDGIVWHTDGVYLIDQQGREVEFVDEGFDPHALAADLGLLLAQSGPPPSSAGGSGQPSAPEGSYQSLVVAGDMLTFSSTHGQYGTYTLGITLRNGRGAPIAGATVSADLKMTDMVMEPEHVAFRPDGQAGAGDYSAQGVLTMAGPWQAHIHVRFPVTLQPLPGMASMTPPPLDVTFDFSTQI